MKINVEQFIKELNELDIETGDYALVIKALYASEIFDSYIPPYKPKGPIIQAVYAFPTSEGSITYTDPVKYSTGGITELNTKLYQDYLKEAIVCCTNKKLELLTEDDKYKVQCTGCHTSVTDYDDSVKEAVESFNDHVINISR